MKITPQTPRSASGNKHTWLLLLLLLFFPSTLPASSEIGIGSGYGWFMEDTPPNFKIYETEPLLLFFNPAPEQLFSLRLEAGWNILWEVDEPIREGEFVDGRIVMSDDPTIFTTRVHSLVLRPLIIVSSPPSRCRYYASAGCEGSLAIEKHHDFGHGNAKNTIIGNASFPFPEIKFSLRIGGGIDYLFGRWRIGIQPDFCFFVSRFFQSREKGPVIGTSINTASLKSDEFPHMIAAGLPGDHLQEAALPPLFSLRINVGFAGLFDEK